MAGWAKLWIAGTLLAAGTSAHGIAPKGLQIRPSLDARLRYEVVEQDGLIENARALTARLRAGLEASSGPLSVLAEAEGTWAPDEHYNSGTNGLARYPVVADPENLELNRLQLQYRDGDRLIVTAGRQRINIDDQRFVGASGWRQNEQTFDALRVEAGKLGPLRLDLTYAPRVNTIYGREAGKLPSRSATRQHIDGDNVFATAALVLGPIKAQAFAYLLDQNEPGRLSFSSQTYGLRAAVTLPAGPSRIGLNASFARQSDYGGNPNSYSADYWLGEASITHAGITLAGGYEVLGAGTGPASFQTPLATLHRYNGWADKFVITPPAGLRDLSLSIGGSFPKSRVEGLHAHLAWHRFTSDRASRDYGSEWNGQVGVRLRKASLLLKHARYQAGTFATDTDKTWLQLEWAY